MCHKWLYVWFPGSEISTDDRSFLMLKLNSMDVSSTQVFFYPRLIPMVRYIFISMTTENMHIRNVHIYFESQKFLFSNTVYREIFSLFYFLSIRPRFHRANLRLGQFQCLKLSPLKHNSVLANSRWGGTVCICWRAKITRDENNPVYSN